MSFGSKSFATNSFATTGGGLLTIISQYEYQWQVYGNIVSNPFEYVWSIQQDFISNPFEYQWSINPQNFRGDAYNGIACQKNPFNDFSNIPLNTTSCNAPTSTVTFGNVSVRSCN